MPSAAAIKSATRNLKNGATRPVALTIAGSDNSCGAGIQADLKTFCAFGCYGLTVVTSVVAEVPGKVLGIQGVKSGLVVDQLKLCLEHYPVRAIKTGMLYSAGIIEAVVDVLEQLPLQKRPWLVVDPVMIASSGDALLKPGAVRLYRERLFPMADLITPNLDELQALAGKRIHNSEEMQQEGRRLAKEFKTNFLLKGGHLQGKEAIDVLIQQRSLAVKKYMAPFINAVKTHGTGCTYSAAIAARLARGDGLEEAVSTAKRYITQAIKYSLRYKHLTALRHFPPYN